MAYKLEHFAADHQEVLQGALLDWSKDDHDIYLISDEGHKIFTHKILLYFYSHTLGPVLDSLPLSTSKPAISVSASSNSISNLLKLLTTGQAASNNKETLVDVKDAAKALGISLGNCLLEAKRVSGQVTIRKLPVKTEQKNSPSKVPPTNLSVFKNRDSGIAGISKWNTVIASKNKITQVPAEDNTEVHNEDAGENDKETDLKMTLIRDLKLACDLCPKVFSSKKNVKRHKLEKHQNEEQHIGTASIVKIESEFPCDDCDREFDSDFKLKKHALQHSNRFTCDVCQKGFQSSSTLKNHKNIHLDEKPFKCEICEKEFTQAGNLKTHMIRHHGISDFKPDVSTNSLASGNNELEDNGERSSSADKCGYCEENFDDASELNSHMVLMHSIQEMIVSSD